MVGWLQGQVVRFRTSVVQLYVHFLQVATLLHIPCASFLIRPVRILRRLAHEAHTTHSHRLATVGGRGGVFDEMHRRNPSTGETPPIHRCSTGGDMNGLILTQVGCRLWELGLKA